MHAVCHRYSRKVGRGGGLSTPIPRLRTAKPSVIHLSPAAEGPSEERKKKKKKKKKKKNGQ
jgi:hypothetical protein